MIRKSAKRCVFCNDEVVKQGDVVFKCFCCGAVFDLDDFEDGGEL
jgi:predicted RNA-binding Zn-ribbon protein involved in translation (DUF1610 family)